MARLWSSGAEENSTTVEGQIATGSVSVDATIHRAGGSYSFKTSAAGSAAYYRYQWSVGNQNQQMYYRGYIYISSLPSAEDKVFWIDRTQTDGVMGLRLETNGVLRLYNEAPTTPAQVGSDSSALSTNTWYRLEIAMNNTTATSTVVTAYINGVSFASGTVNTSNHGAQAVFGWGSRNNVTATYYFDDLGVNDTSGSFQNSLLGPGQIIHLHPNAAGDNNGFLVNVGGTAGAANNYTRVNENPPDDATSYNGSAVLNSIDDFNVDDTPSSIGASDTINNVMVGIRFSAAASSLDSTLQVRIKKTSSGTVAVGMSNDTPNSTTWKTNQVVVPTNNYLLVAYQDPDNSNWTKSTLDSMQIGYKVSTASTNAAYVSNIWALVESIPSTVFSVPLPIIINQSINRSGTY